MPLDLAVNAHETRLAEVKMIKELDNILQRQLLLPLFMPIVNTQERCIIGYEALIRGPASSPLHSPISLFKTAQRCGRLLELELLCREISMRRFKHLGLDGKLFLNVTPATLAEPDFKSGMTLELLEKVGFDPEKLVIEITEQFPIDDYDMMKEATAHYRELGFEVALDDLGAGYSGLRSWSELRPQYVKIDRHFIEGLDTAQIKQEFVRSIMEVARSIQCQVIAEGIERIEEHRILNEMGLKIQQGYYFSRPTALPPKELDSQLFRFSNGSNSNHLTNTQQNLSSITRVIPPIDADCSIGEAVQVLRNHKEVRSLAVVDGDTPIGLLSRDTCLGLYLDLFGREIHDRKSVKRYMDINPLVLEDRTALEAVSDRITRSNTETPSADFIITNQGKYLGIGSIVNLLKLITECQIRNARYANPLTLLPGSVPASEEVTWRLKQRAEFAACYFDLDNFKSFNDHYGYQRGDQLIVFLADCIKHWINDTHDLICHIGGDDFLVLVGSPDWQLRCKQIQAEFESRVAEFYNKQDREAGGIESLDRHGTTRFFPLVTISIGIALPDPDRCSSHHDVARLASDAKHIAKKQTGHSLFVNRRRGPDSNYDDDTTVSLPA
ncbi:MAG: EAL and GGDEF domain-containing protein [Motiliproteus sp.]|nr:EAL and GGDEF domain-containing protein [Motiliproteus sp.]MCW9054342.1 EAL and GGDEF domain-containing protein [Motiliproteus sp.]